MPRRDRFNVDPFDEIPRGYNDRRGKRDSLNVIPSLDVVILLCTGMHGHIAYLLQRQIQANDQSFECSCGHRYGIGEDLGAGWDDDRGRSTKREVVDRGRIDTAAPCACGNGGNPNAQGFDTELIGEPYSKLATGDRRVNHLSQGGVDQCWHCVPRISLEDGCGP